MLPSQRDAFDMPRDVAYINAASWSPLPKAVAEAGRRGIERKSHPWVITAEHQATQYARARKAAAALIGADAADIALISSVGYGVATASKIMEIPSGSRVLVLAEDHSSPTLEWHSRAPRDGFSVDTVAQPADGDWTAAVLAAIERPGAAPLALVSISNVHWSDGGVVDLDRIRPAIRKAGAALLVDATHGAGIMDLDVARLDPDFLIFPTYKWVLGPYGRAFLYVAKRRQQGEPLEQTSYGRRGVNSESAPYFADLRYAEGAKRFDMGERDHIISLEMAAVAMEMMHGWGQPAIQARLAMLTGLIADGVRNTGVQIPDEAIRAPHVLSLGFPAGMKDGLIEALAAEGVHVAPRLGRMRISPHVYNDEQDVEKFVATFRRLAF